MAEIINPGEFGKAVGVAIEQLESRIGSKLPMEYRTFLAEQNGGIPSPDRYYLEEIQDYVTIETLFGLHEGPRHVNLEAHIEEWGFALLPEYLPIGYEQGGNPICMRLSGEDAGSIMLWDKELHDEKILNRTLTMHHMAASLNEFFERLEG